MCGIAGVLDPSGASRDALTDAAASMAETLCHRGPDDAGCWVDPEPGVAFGHRRLAVVDLSAEGRQPMVSSDGRYVLTYNGEIYNFRTMRGQLEAAGIRFRGHSDTEVLVEAVARWGVEASLTRLNGMFAFALWDRAERRLFLARDRLGEKPLYYGRCGRAFVFGSELKAIRAHPAFSGDVDRGALTQFLRYGYVPAPRSIYEGIAKLRPGYMLTVGPDALDPIEHPYWRLPPVGRTQIALDAVAAVEEFDGLLQDAVALRMVADVPVGAFLSGGIDSSTVVALMQEQSFQPVKTFTIGFKEAGYDEAAYSGKVARHLGTDHTELYVSPSEALDVIPSLPQIYDEPFADSSQVPTYLVARLARERVTVALSGDGGDELFGGYDRYRWAGRIRRAQRMLPRPARRRVAAGLGGRSPQDWAAVVRHLRRIMPGGSHQERWGERIHRVANLIDAERKRDLYLALMSHWQQPSRLVVGNAAEPETALLAPDVLAGDGPFFDEMAYADILTYLPDDILTKVDRATMAVSLEARVPLLDHRIVEFSRGLPHRLKVRRGSTKWLVRRVLERRLPLSMVDRPKMGFGVPVGSWLRGPLREWAGDLLSPDRIRGDGFLEPDGVRQAWDRHLSGDADNAARLWGVLMFQAWLEAQ